MKIVKTFPLLLLCSLLACMQQKMTEAQAFDTLAQHYQTEQPIAFHFKYETLRFNPYQSYDYRSPDSLIGSHEFWLDQSRHEFFARRSASFPGGFEFTSNEFQIDTVSLTYDTNGLLLGKEATPQGQNRVDQIQTEIQHLWSADIISNLLATPHDSINIQINTTDNELNITLATRIDTLIHHFNLSTFRLNSVQNTTTKEKWHFSNHQETNRIKYANKVTYFRNNNLHTSYKISLPKLISHIPDEYLTIPKGYTIRTQLPTSEPTIEKIAHDLYLISPIARDRNVLFKVHESTITVFGAPIADRFSQKVIQKIQSQFPSKPITEVYITHYHSDHIGGLSAYANLGATILIDTFGIEAIKAFPRFSKNIQHFKFKPIHNAMKRNGVQYFIPNDTHCRGHSFAYFPDSQIIYEGDYLEIPADNSIPEILPETTAIFLDFIERNNLVIKRVVGHHRNGGILGEVVHEYRVSRVR